MRVRLTVISSWRLIRRFKTVVPGKAPEKQLDKAFQEASGFSIYQAVRAAKAKEKGFVTLGK